MNERYGRTDLLCPDDGQWITDDPQHVLTRSVLVIDPVSSGKLFPPVLRQLGLPTILLDTPSALAADLRRSPSADDLDFDRDFCGDVFQLRDYCLCHDVGYVVAGCESAIELCEQLRALLPRCPQNAPEKPSRRWDKFDMMSALADAGVPHLHTARMFGMDDFDRKVDGLANLSTMIVKPSRGAGSVDVMMVDDVEGARSAVARVLDRPGFFGDEVSALVQEYYAGDEYVVDMFSHRGQHELISMCVYQKALRAGAFIYERSVWLEPDHEDLSPLMNYASEVLDALGVRNGASHIEIIMGPAGPRLVDFGARPAGAGIPDMTFHLIGTSQVHAESAYVKSVCDPTARGSYTGTADYRPDSHGAIVFFNIERPGTFLAAEPDRELGGIEGVVDATINATYGQSYPATRSLIDSLHLGSAFVTADTASELDRVCSRVNRTVLSWFSPAPTGHQPRR